MKIIGKLSIYSGLSCLVALSIAGCSIAPAPQTTYRYVQVEILPYRDNKGSSDAEKSKDESRMCRLTCFSYDAEHALYSIPDRLRGKLMYVKGFVNVVGKKDKNQICRPANYASSDISKLQKFKDLCEMTVYSCGNKCWANGSP